MRWQTPARRRSSVFWLYFSSTPISKSSWIYPHFLAPSSFMFSLFFNLITHWLQFMLPIYFWIWDHPVKHGRSIRKYISWYIYIYKTNTPCPSPRNPSTVHSSLVRGGASELSHSMQECGSCLVFCRQLQLLWAHEVTGPHGQKMLCCSSSSHLWLLQTFYPLLYNGPQLWRGSGTEKSCLWMRTLQSLTLCMWVSWGFWVSSHPSCTEQLLWRGRRAALTYRETETTLKINLALCPLSKNNSSRLMPEVCKLPIRWLRNIFKVILYILSR